MFKSLQILTSLFIFSLFTLSVSAEKYNTDSALAELDKVLANKSYYENVKQKRITKERFLLHNSPNDTLKYTSCGRLFYEYRSYKMDSAYYFACLQLASARKINNQDSISEALMNLADGLKGLAKLIESQEILNSVPHSSYIKHNPKYYHLKHSITLLRFMASIDENEASQLNKDLITCRDSIAMVNDPNSIGGVINKAEQYKLNGKYNEALKLLQGYLNTDKKQAFSNAIFLCSLADAYKFLNNEEAQKYYLTLGAIQDKLDCKKTYTSLQQLALLLNKEEDTERAYRYITYALDDIISSNAKNRLNQVAEMVPIITHTYTEQQQKDAQRRDILTACVIVLLLIIAGALVVLFLRNRKLNAMREILDKKNEELGMLNNNLEFLNRKLSDSNKIKEEYIAQLFNLCSGYIEDMSKFKVSLGRKLKAGQITEVESLLKSSHANTELKEFFTNFDSVFLDLFPNFIEDFNKLLLDDSSVLPKEGELLSPELRIYALIRLGINDSTKIASFLHFSPQTVYNYRQKTRNKAKDSKEIFLDKVQNL